MVETSLTPQVDILVVDDRSDNLTAMQAILEEFKQYRVTTASCGPEAIERVKETDFALILLDLQMPNMDGYQTATEIKKLPRGKNVPIMMVTAIFREDPHILKGYAVGAIDFITKPFNPDILRAKVAVYAELHRKSRQLLEKEKELLKMMKLEAAARHADGTEDGAPLVNRQALRETPRGNETILVVEDEGIVRRVVTRGLAQQGYRILEARSPQEALAVAEREPKIDLLLSDMIMPGMTGANSRSKWRPSGPGSKSC